MADTVQYYGRDIDLIRETLISNIRKKNETLTQFTGSDPGMMLIDAMALVADQLNYYIDRGRLETYISSCTQKSSIIRIADLTSYFIKGVQPPSVDVLVSSTTLPYSFSRKQIELNGAPYVIITPVVLDSTRNSSTVAAYNGVDKSIIVPINSLDLFDPKVIIGDSKNIPSQGLKVQLDFDDNIIELPKLNWFASRTENDKVEIHIRDNRIAAQGAKKLFISYIEIEESEFQLVPKDTVYTENGLTITTLGDSSPGSGDEILAEVKRNIIGSNIQLETLVSVLDFQILAESDLEVRRAAAFDINTPSVVSENDKVVIYLDLNYDIDTLPLSVTSRLDYEVQSKANILGITHEWKLANKVKFDINAKIFSLATDQLDKDAIISYLKDKYSKLEFGRKVSEAEISKDLLRYSQFIEYVEVVNPDTTVNTPLNEIPIVDNITITIIQGGLYDS